MINNNLKLLEAKHLLSIIEFASILNSNHSDEQIISAFMLTSISNLTASKIAVATFEENLIVKKFFSKGNIKNLDVKDLNITSFENLQDVAFCKANEIKLVNLLIFNSQKLGIVWLGKKIDNKEYSENEIEFFNALCNILSLALFNLRHIENLTSLNKKLNEKIQRINNLLEISKESNRATDETKASKIFAYSLLGHFGFKKIAFVLNEKNSAKVKFAIGFNEEKIIALLNDFVLRKNGNISREEFSHYFDEYLIKNGVQSLFKVSSKQNFDLYILLGERIKNEELTKDDEDYIFLVARAALSVYENLFFVSQLLRKQKIEEELQIAKTTQKNLFPKKIPKCDSYEFFGLNEPSLEVGGDYFDFIKLNDEELLALIADVSGKGLAAALTMSNLQAYIKAFAKNGLSHSNLVSNTILLNKLICENIEPGNFITLFWGVLNIKTGEFFYVNAGHNYPYFISNDKIICLKEGGLPLGVLKSYDGYVSSSIKFNKGDLLVAFTDGVIEAKNSNDEEFGEKRLTGLIMENKDLKADELAEKIFFETKEFSKSLPQFDDITILIIKKIQII